MDPSELRDFVDEFIHETYLESLDDEALVRELESFSETCGRVISRSISDGAKIMELNRRLSLIRQNQLRDEERRAIHGEMSGGGRSNAGIRKARRIIENKKLILRAIEEVAPEAACQIRRAVDPANRRLQARSAPPSAPRPAAKQGIVTLESLSGAALPLTRVQIYGAGVAFGAFFVFALARLL